jgi:hypothetical protein
MAEVALDPAVCMKFFCGGLLKAPVGSEKRYKR